MATNPVDAIFSALGGMATFFVVVMAMAALYPWFILAALRRMASSQDAMATQFERIADAMAAIAGGAPVAPPNQMPAAAAPPTPTRTKSTGGVRRGTQVIGALVVALGFPLLFVNYTVALMALAAGIGLMVGSFLLAKPPPSGR